MHHQVSHITELRMEPPAAIRVCCPKPKCPYVVSARSEGAALRWIGQHMLEAHRPPTSVLPGIDAGRTWGDFLAAMNELGVTLTTPIASIEYGVSQWGTGRLELEVDPVAGLMVREVSRSEVA